MRNLEVEKQSASAMVKPPWVELPTMEKTSLGDQKLVHYSHPQHPLVQVSLPYLFTCVGCKEYGAGNRFTCRTCDFYLHYFCAVAPPALLGHPFHSQHQLVFFTRPGGLLWSRCDVCSKAVKGCAFRCTSCSFVMHPCCSTLRGEMSFPVHAHPLRISPPTAAPHRGGDSDGACGVCQRRRLGRVYRCTSCDYQLHAVCAKAMSNGLHASGINPPEKTNKLLAAGRVASQVFLELMAGLIEGIGEGLGEALIESIGKGRSRNSVRIQ